MMMDIKISEGFFSIESKQIVDHDPTLKMSTTVGVMRPQRPRQLDLRRTSSCSALPLQGIVCQKPQHPSGPRESTGFTCSGNLCCISALKRDRNNGSAEYTNENPIPKMTVALPTLREGVEHISDLHNPDPACHFCREPKSRSVHEDCTRLKIVSRGLVRSRDGSHLSPNSQPYISLPSPNVQSVNDDDPLGARIPVAKEDEEEMERKDGNPDTSQMVRRGALVPGKIVDEGEEADDMSISNGHQDHVDRYTFAKNFPRRSSVVVIPPMQVCPGDLLVYSKALTHCHNLEFDGSINNLTNDTDVSGYNTTTSRKGKNTWSLLKLFDREKKPKCGGTLEEVLAGLAVSEFTDEHLLRLSGLKWSDFVDLAGMDRQGGVLFWNSNTNTLSVATRDREDSTATITTMLHSSEDSPKDPSPSPPMSSLAMAAANNRTAKARALLKRAQSERAYDLPGKNNLNNNYRPLLENESSVDTVDSQMTNLDDSLGVPAVPPARRRTVSTLLGHSITISRDGEGSTRFLAAIREQSRIEAKRREAVWDLFQSEMVFLIDHLMVSKNVFMEPLKKVQVEGFIMFAEPEVLFGNLDELCCVTYSFCKEFLQVLMSNVSPDGDLNVTDVMRRMFEKSSKARVLSQAYHRYALNYINALNYLETLRRQQEFCDFEKWCNRDPRCKKLQLTDLLVSPVHHIMKIPLVVKDIETRTEDPEEKAVITRILEVKESSLRDLDDKMKWLKNFDRLLEIQRNIVWPSVLEIDPKQYYPEFLKSALSRQPCERLIVSPRRQILIEGQLLLLDSGKPTEMFVILFDDLLLICRKKKALSKKKSSIGENWPVGGRLTSSSTTSGGSSDVSIKYIVHKQPLSLDRFFIHEVTSSEALSAKLDNAFILICLNRFQQIVAVHTFQAESEQLKNNWLTKLRDAQGAWKRTLQTTVFKGGPQGVVDCNQSPLEKHVPNIIETNKSL